MNKILLLVGLVVFLSPLFANAKEKHDGYYENITKKNCIFFKMEIL